jgi:hypothetical protein
VSRQSNVEMMGRSQQSTTSEASQRESSVDKATAQGKARKRGMTVRKNRQSIE